MRLCSVPGCQNKHAAKGYCKTHWAINKRRGEIPVRTRLDGNECIIDGQDCIVVLYDTYGIEKVKTFVDRSDLAIVKQHKWHENNKGYAMTVINGKKEFMHNILLGKKRGAEIDHIDGDPLNNRRNNLRRCTHQQNMRNRHHCSSNRSGIIGVAFYSYRNAWVARINYDGKSHHIGSYKTMEAAIAARVAAAKKHFKEFSPH